MPSGIHRKFSPYTPQGRMKIRMQVILALLKNHQPATGREVHQYLRQLPTFIGVGQNDVNNALYKLRDLGMVEQDIYSFWRIKEQTNETEKPSSDPSS